ncbi:MAG: 16S rRNA (cytidine(1402)-2'-O)-methyltransferase [Lentisphaeria bacterium]|nr:16S rRNA (cytidine(1402)-2'-O)-methyltransferase [Lentisphaeria bacterium]
MSTLYIIATPIGNLEDVSLRSLRILREVHALACEDTRHTRRLLDRHEIPKPPMVFSFHDHNENYAAEGLIALLRDGKPVGIVSNAGYPCISDPGYPAVVQAIEEGFKVEVIPGASAVPVALIASGLPTSSYIFKGFPPKKIGKRASYIEMDAHLPHTTIYYESPHRIGKLLAAALEVLGDRRAAVCLELTKQFERVERGWLSELVIQFDPKKKVKGEAVVVIAGNHPKFIRGNIPSEEES